MTIRLRISPTAEQQIEEASAWWAEHRPMAPGAFDEDLQRGFDLMRAMPGAGQRVAHSRRDGVRRLVLGRIRYFVYYVQVDEETIDVLAVWHASRGGEPRV